MEIYLWIISFLVLILFYIFFLYPLILKLLSRFYSKPLITNPDYQPELTIIIAEYNEDELIEGCINSIFTSDYPFEKIRIIIGSDGSGEKVIGKIKKLRDKHSNILHFIFPRSGKNKVINELSQIAETDLILYLDADLRLQKSTISSLVEKCSDNDVGAAISKLHIISENKEDNAGRFGETTYMKYDTDLRILESKIFGTVNSPPPLMIKRNLFNNIPNNRICDDFFIILNIHRQKKRVIFDNDSVTLEVRKKSLNDEFSRRIRTVSGGLATVWNLKKLLLPYYGWTCFFLWSHKMLRWLSPFILILILILTFFLPQNSIYFLFLMPFQLLFYVLAMFGSITEKKGIKFKAARVALYFVSMNFSFIPGWFRFLRGSQNAEWEHEV